MNRLISKAFIFVFFVFLPIHVYAQSAQFSPSLGQIIQELSDNENPQIIEDDFESDLINPDFLIDDGLIYDDYTKIKVRILDKITAESRTFDLDIEKTVAYGALRIRPMTCKKTPPIEEPESAGFLQIWEKSHEGQAEWIFSGWMFASSPSLSSMEHPVYDIWVEDCGGDIIATTDIITEPIPE
jgi:hypothetical protein